MNSCPILPDSGFIVLHNGSEQLVVPRESLIPFIHHHASRDEAAIRGWNRAGVLNGKLYVTLNGDYSKKAVALRDSTPGRLWISIDRYFGEDAVLTTSSDGGTKTAHIKADMLSCQRQQRYELHGDGGVVVGVFDFSWSPLEYWLDESFYCDTTQFAFSPSPEDWKSDFSPTKMILHGKEYTVTRFEKFEEPSNYPCVIISEIDSRNDTHTGTRS